eukprot:1146218-Pelagomonas_calceolata.AAC.3
MKVVCHFCSCSRVCVGCRGSVTLVSGCKWSCRKCRNSGCCCGGGAQGVCTGAEAVGVAVAAALGGRDVKAWDGGLAQGVLTRGCGNAAAVGAAGAHGAGIDGADTWAACGTCTNCRAEK